MATTFKTLDIGRMALDPAKASRESAGVTYSSAGSGARHAGPRLRRC